MAQTIDKTISLILADAASKGLDRAAIACEHRNSTVVWLLPLIMWLLVVIMIQISILLMRELLSHPLRAATS